MKLRRIWLILFSLLLILCLCILPLGYYVATRHFLPVPVKRNLYEGIIYTRTVNYLPDPLVVHIVTVEIKKTGMRFLVTPPDFTEKMDEHPLMARTTTEFMNDFGVNIAINGDGFTPWYSNTALDYYPRSGDPVTPNGLSISKGKSYSDGPGPTLYVTANNVFSFNSQTGKPQNAISGDRMLVIKGQAIEALDDVERAPRTAIGVDKRGRTLILIVADGRQPFYSQGMTFAEVAALMISYGAENAMSLDGGGSSTLVVRDKNGQIQVLNSPIDAGIPGRERSVANHFGIFIGK